MKPALFPAIAILIEAGFGHSVAIGEAVERKPFRRDQVFRKQGGERGVDVHIAGKRCPMKGLGGDHFGERDDLMEYTDQGVGEFQYALLPCPESFGGIVRAVIRKY